MTIKTICYGLLTFVALTTAGCKSQTQKPVKIPLFENEKRAIIIPAVLGDSTTARLSFDTGANMGSFYLDSEFCTLNKLPFWDRTPERTGTTLSSAWAPPGELSKRRSVIHESGITAKIADADINFKWLHIFDMSDFTAELDGMFNVGRNDTTHVWELNFEHEYLEIHKAADFKMPKDCRIFPMVNGSRDNSLYIQFPITFTTSDGDSVTIDHPYLLDTGALMDFSILNPAEGLDFFNGKKAQTLLVHGYGYRSRYDVSALAFGDMQIDSMRVYTIENHNTNTPYIIGMNFLKRFNVFLDMSTQTVGLQPINNFKRVINPYDKTYYYSVQKRKDDRMFVEEVTDLPNNYYKDAGLMAGDEIIAVNGRSVKEKPNRKLPDTTIRTRVMELMRKGVPVTITVNSDPQVEWGE